jgi:hypothetical protein
MHLLPATAGFAPPASSTALSALSLATQIGGSGIAAHDLERYALGAHAAAGEVPQYGRYPRQVRAAAANRSMGDAMPCNVRTARLAAATTGRHVSCRYFWPAPTRPTASKTKSSDAMPYNVRTAVLCSKHT